MSTEEPIITCPHCKEAIIMAKLNCAVFRHGILKRNMKQINPHTKKEKCDALFRANLIYGCGKPFRVIVNDNTYDTEICDYI
jgi:hypothetical protein